MTTTIPAIKIGIDGDVSAIELESSADHSTLRSLYAHIDCQVVEAFDVRDGGRDIAVTAWLDEEGRLNGSTPNAVASAAIAALQGHLQHGEMWSALAMLRDHPERVHFGNIVFTGHDARTGNTVGIPTDAATELRTYVDSL